MFDCYSCVQATEWHQWYTRWEQEVRNAGWAKSGLAVVSVQTELSPYYYLFIIVLCSIQITLSLLLPNLVFCYYGVPTCTTWEVVCCYLKMAWMIEMHIVNSMATSKIGVFLSKMNIIRRKNGIKKCSVKTTKGRN